MGWENRRRSEKDRGERRDWRVEKAETQREQEADDEVYIEDSDPDDDLDATF